ncbi:MAG: AAA family ATPase [Cellulosilyticaceae bacterium]
MSNTLKFNKLQYKGVFCSEFEDFNKNNVLSFGKNISVLYGPNGTGKTSLSKTLSIENADENIYFEVEYNSQKVNSTNEVFHVISDQNSRNIIKGTAKDYLIGDEIEREETLLKEIENYFNQLVDSLRKDLKDHFNISTKTSKVIDSIDSQDVKNMVIKFANKQFKSTGIDKELYICTVENLQLGFSSFDRETDVYKFIINNYKDIKSIVHKIKQLDITRIVANTKIKEIEENDEAIKMLNKFSYKDECIVCDNKDYDKVTLLRKKTANKAKVEQELDQHTKDILNGIIKLTREYGNDPLDIENIFLEAIKTGDTQNIVTLKNTLELYLQNIGQAISNLVKSSLDTEILSKYEEYRALLNSQIKISEEDLLYLKEVIGENIGRDIDISRDTNNRLKITLGGAEFLTKDRNDLGLSTGQQNFISLSFELLKAKKSTKPYIVLDDPISSFDSIYKNKIAFCIVKFLEGRKQIILTHNTELIKLLEFQSQNSFELYMLNNTEGGENGFIQVNKDEKNLLVQLNTLLDLFRGDILSYIKQDDDGTNKQRFLMSMIPFMRGYANIIGNKLVYKELCKVMHGYESKYVDIGRIYNTLFNNNTESDDIKFENIKVTIEDILNIDLENSEIIDSSMYPLLNKSLYHTLNYLFLRLKVERELCLLENNKVLNLIQEKKERRGNKYTGETTQNIIDAVFPRTDSAKIKERVFFTSRKTLLNEFNHFEGNMNIFQPAIDITDKALLNEKTSILEMLERIATPINRTSDEVGGLM